MTGDPIVYAHSNGSDYVMRVDEPMNGWEPGWWLWPAEAKGWTQKRRLPEPSTDLLLSWHELPAFNAMLALRLSGAES